MELVGFSRTGPAVSAAADSVVGAAVCHVRYQRIGQRDQTRYSPVVHIEDGTGRIQIYIKKDVVGEHAFNLLKLIDLADFLDRLFRRLRGRPAHVLREDFYYRINVVPLRIPLWPTIFAPHLAGVANYLLFQFDVCCLALFLTFNLSNNSVGRSGLDKQLLPHVAKRPTLCAMLKICKKYLFLQYVDCFKYT